MGLFWSRVGTGSPWGLRGEVRDLAVDGSRWQAGGTEANNDLPLGQDKPDFVKRRVRKLLTAGVVSALACMVKSENPALTNSCRELISRYGRAGCVAGRELGSEAAGAFTCLW